MTFDEWVDKAYAKYKDMDGFELSVNTIKTGMVKEAWNAAVEESAKLAWSYTSQYNINKLKVPDGQLL